MLAIAPGCDWDVQRGPDWLLVRVRNVDLLDPDAPDLTERLWSLLEQHFTYRLVLELDEETSLNRRLAAQLLKLYRRIEEHDGVLRLCGLSPCNRHFLHTCRLDARLPPYDDPESAVMARPHHPVQPR